MLLKMSALADMSPVGDKKSSRTFQRNFSEEKFLSEGPQSDCNRREGPSLSVSLRDTEIHSSCAQLTHKEFRALRSASRGSAPTPRKPSRRLDPSFVPWVRIKILCQHNKSRAKSNSDHRNSYFAATLAASALNAMSVKFVITPPPVPSAWAHGNILPQAKFLSHRVAM